MGSPSLCAKPAKVAASNSSKVNLASRDNKANKVVSSNKLVVAKVVSRINLVLHLVKVRDKVNKASLKVKVLVELVNSNTTTTKAAVKVDSSKVKADSKTKVTAKDKATSNNKLEVNRTKAMVKVKTSSSNSKVTEMATSHVLTVEARDTLTLTVKRHHTRLGTRLRKTLLKKLAARWLQLMQLNKLSQTQFRTPLRCLASQLRASSRAVLLPATSSTASYEAAVSQVSSLSVLSL